MPLYKSELIDLIVSTLEKENTVILEDVSSWHKIRSFDLLERSKNMALNLQIQGFKAGDLSVIFVKDSIEFVTTLLAIMMAWGRTAILDPEMGQQVLIEKFRALKPDHLFINWILHDILKSKILNTLFKHKTKNFSPELIDIPKNIIIQGTCFFWTERLNTKQLYQKSSNTYQRKEIDEEQDALVVFTWWTTSQPKWVVHSYSSLYHTLKEIKTFSHNSKVFYADLPHFILLWMISWAKVIIWQESFSTFKLEKILKKHYVDTTFFAPYKLQQFMLNNISFPKTLRKVLIWSAPVYQSFLSRLVEFMPSHTEIFCIYGMTEMLPATVIDGREKINLTLAGDVIWKPITWVEYKIIEEELFVKGRHMMKNYLGQASTEYIQTWDLAKEQNWYIVLTGRKKDMIIKGDYNIYPGVYEEIINRIPWVVACAMFWTEIEDNDEKIILAVESTRLYDKKEFLKLLQKWSFSIDTYALPDEIIFCQIPRSWRQKKIDKWMIRRERL